MNATWNSGRILLVIAAICFAIALLMTLGALRGNEDAFLAGGFLSWVLAGLIP